MTFCGYSPEMSEGLDIFGKGVAVSTITKAKIAGRSISEHIDVELSQLDVLITELSKFEKIEKNEDKLDRLKVLKSLAIVCQVCFKNAKNVKNQTDFHNHFAKQFNLYGNLIKYLESAYESCTPGTDVLKRTKIGINSAVTLNSIKV